MPRLKLLLKQIGRDFIVRLQKPLGWLVKLFLRPIALIMSLTLRGNEAYPIFAHYGFHLLRQHYFLPIPDADDLSFIKDTELAGVDMNEQGALKLLDDVILKYKAEFNAFPHHDTGDPSQFYLINGNYMAIDGNVYYALIRHYKPRRVVEIGSGYSTLLAAEAIRKNRAEGADAAELICIEPYPRPMLRRQIPEMTQLIEKRVQAVPLDFFQALQAGDILFIDSTHALKPGGDVWWEYCEILPRLAPGVLVHIHDVSLPKPYPKVYFDYHWYWTEQYLLQAFLAFNHRFEVIWPGNYLMTKYSERMQEAFAPEYQLMRAAWPSSEPSALWMRVREV